MRVLGVNDWHSSRSVELPFHLFKRQEYGKSRTAAPIAYATDDVDCSFVLFNNAPAHPESQTGSLFSFGRVEGGKEIAFHAQRYARAAINDRCSYTFPRRIIRVTAFPHA